jgi:hypothetical protein
MARRKAPPTEDALSGRASAMAPADSVYLSKSIKSEFIYLGLALRADHERTEMGRLKELQHALAGPGGHPDDRARSSVVRGLNGGSR